MLNSSPATRCLCIASCATWVASFFCCKDFLDLPAKCRQWVCHARHSLSSKRLKKSHLAKDHPSCKEQRKNHYERRRLSSSKENLLIASTPTTFSSKSTREQKNEVLHLVQLDKCHALHHCFLDLDCLALRPHSSSVSTLVVHLRHPFLLT